jgi:hypothetical protein
LAVLPYHNYLLRWGDVVARDPIDEIVVINPEVFGKVTFFRGKAVTSAHKNILNEMLLIENAAWSWRKCSSKSGNVNPEY